MVGKVTNVTAGIGAGNKVSDIAPVDLDINLKGQSKGHNLHVVSPCASLCHTNKVCVERFVNIRFRNLKRVLIFGSRRRLPFGLAASSPAGHDFNVVFVGVFVSSDVFDGAMAELVVAVLGAVELVGEGIEQAVAYGPSVSNASRRKDNSSGLEGDSRQMDSQNSPSPRISAT